MITVYGIKNCSTMKKAFAWLDAQGIDYQFHDYKKLAVPLDCLQRWSAERGWSVLLNRRGTTWRKLSPHEREPLEREIPDAAAALALMQTHSSLIRRPIIEFADGWTIGFDATIQAELTEKLLGKGQK